MKLEHTSYFVRTQSFENKAGPSPHLFVVFYVKWWGRCNFVLNRYPPEISIVEKR